MRVVASGRDLCRLELAKSTCRLLSGVASNTGTSSSVPFRVRGLYIVPRACLSDLMWRVTSRSMWAWGTSYGGKFWRVTSSSIARVWILMAWTPTRNQAFHKHHSSTGNHRTDVRKLTRNFMNQVTLFWEQQKWRMGFVTAKKTHECVRSYDTNCRNTCNNTEKKRGKMWMELSKNESIII